jgi:hypothetical protein
MANAEIRIQANGLSEIGERFVQGTVIPMSGTAIVSCGVSIIVGDRFFGTGEAPASIYCRPQKPLWASANRLRINDPVADKEDGRREPNGLRTNPKTYGLKSFITGPR